MDEIYGAINCQYLDDCGARKMTGPLYHNENFMRRLDRDSCRGDPMKCRLYQIKCSSEGKNDKLFSE